jgi:hypothetical protein
MELQLLLKGVPTARASSNEVTVVSSWEQIMGKAVNQNRFMSARASYLSGSAQLRSSTVVMAKAGAKSSMPKLGKVIQGLSFYGSEAGVIQHVLARSGALTWPRHQQLGLTTPPFARFWRVYPRSFCANTCCRFLFRKRLGFHPLVAYVIGPGSSLSSYLIS